jgi:hypothetical protein
MARILRWPGPQPPFDAQADQRKKCDAVATLEVCARYGDFANNVSIRTENLADGPGQEFSDPITDLGAGDDEHPVPVAAVLEEVGLKGRAGM